MDQPEREIPRGLTAAGLPTPPDRAERLLRTTSVLLLALGAVSLLVGLLSIVGTARQPGIPLVFLGGGVLFALLGGLLIAGIRRRQTGSGESLPATHETPSKHRS